MEYNEFTQNKELIYYSNDRGIYSGKIKWSQISIDGLSQEDIDFFKEAVGILAIWSGDNEFVVEQKDLKRDALFTDNKKPIYYSREYELYNKKTEWYSQENFSKISENEIKKFKENKNVLGLWVGNNELAIMTKVGSKLDED